MIAYAWKGVRYWYACVGSLSDVKLLFRFSPASLLSLHDEQGGETYWCPAVAHDGHLLQGRRQSVHSGLTASEVGGIIVFRLGAGWNRDSCPTALADERVESRSLQSLLEQERGRIWRKKLQSAAERRI